MSHLDYKASCFVLIGPPASGKSTWRQANLNPMFTVTDSPRLGAVVISGDDLIEEECRATGETYSQVFARHDFKEQKRVLRNHFTEAVAGCHDIIIDRTNLTIKGRRSFLASLPKHYRKVAVVFTLAEDILFERLERRGLETGKIIPRRVVEEMIAAYQPPTMGEFDKIIGM